MNVKVNRYAIWPSFTSDLKLGIAANGILILLKNVCQAYCKLNSRTIVQFAVKIEHIKFTVKETSFLKYVSAGQIDQEICVVYADYDLKMNIIFFGSQKVLIQSETLKKC